MKKLLLVFLIIGMFSCTKPFGGAFVYHTFPAKNPTTIATFYYNRKEQNKLWLERNEDASIAWAKIEKRPVYDIPKNQYVYDVKINVDGKPYSITQIIEKDELCVKYTECKISVQKIGINYEFVIDGLFDKIVR